MKTYVFCFVTLTALFLFSCKKENVNSTKQAKNEKTSIPHLTLAEVSADPAKYNYKPIAIGASNARAGVSILVSRKIDVSKIQEQYFIYFNEKDTAIYLSRKSPFRVNKAIMSNRRYFMESWECICSGIGSQGSYNIDDRCFDFWGGGVRYNIMGEALLIGAEGFRLDDPQGQFIGAVSGEFYVDDQVDASFYNAVQDIPEPWLWQH